MSFTGKIVSCVLNQTPLDFSGNLSRILNGIKLAKDQNSDIILFPELAISGVGCEDAFFAPSIAEKSFRILENLLPATSGICAVIGLPLQLEKTLFNAVAIIADTKIIGFCCKPCLSASRLSYECRWFAPWQEKTPQEQEIFGKRYQIRDQFQYKNCHFSIEFSDFLELESHPLTLDSSCEIDLVLNPSVSPFELGKHQKRRDWIQKRASELNIIYAMTNLSGNEAGTILYDGTAMIAFPDKEVSVSERFPFPDVVVHSSENRKFVESEKIMGKNEEFARAVSLGILNFSRKSKTSGFVISLSGGADSTAVAVLIWLGIQLGIREWGIENFKKQFPNLRFSPESQTPESLLHQILVCLYQKSENSSETTRNAAETIANVIGAEYFQSDVTPVIGCYTAMVESMLGETLNWEKHDFPLQNIQARTRGPVAWMIANLRNRLLLTTSNRSEAAVGYATMDGDTCGSLSPIGGIDKHFLRNWLLWLQNDGIQLEDGSVLRLPELEVVTSQQPTAELRPCAMAQTDEKDLMPYHVLEKIEELFLCHLLEQEKIHEQLQLFFPEFDSQQLGIWVKRFFTLWNRSQWKRERFAPSFHVDNRNLSPRSWCRFPILVGDE